MKLMKLFDFNIVLLLVLYENLKELELSALQVPSSIVEILCYLYHQDLSHYHHSLLLSL